MIVRCQIIQNSRGWESTCTLMFSFYSKVKELVTSLGKSDQKWIDDIQRHAVVEVTYLTVQETAAPVVVESKGQGGGMKSSWVLLISHSSTINNITCVGAWTDLKISERFAIYSCSAPYAFHYHDNLRVLTNTITNKASPPSLEVNECHQDCEHHNIYDKWGVLLQADGEDCSEGEYPNPLHPLHNADIPTGHLDHPCYDHCPTHTCLTLSLAPYRHVLLLSLVHNLAYVN